MTLSRWPGHVMLTAQWKKVGDRDSELDKRQYAGVAKGHKPDGQKALGQWPASSIILTRGKEHKFSTFGDRGRDVVEDVSWEHEVDEDEDGARTDAGAGGFFRGYVRGVAGWKMTKVGAGDINHG